jgi:two-component system, chemotaxis family, protein-glutamate methylesterase/glutaminase
VAETKGPKFIIVVGASAGGLNSVIELAAQLTGEVQATVFVVLHLTHLYSGSLLIQRLQKNSSFTCKMAEDGEVIQHRHLYFAVPGKHLLLKENKIILGEGPPENRWRPSIDALFRSAAAAYDSRVIGIVLTGLMQDGTSGMQAIKKSGGTCIVQDPDEAEYPDMPLSVLNNVEVDYCVSLQDMGAILIEKTHDGVPKKHQVPNDIKIEAQIAERVAVNMDVVKELGERSSFTCPDCGGGLWQMKEGDVVRFRCYTGHVYTQDEYEEKNREGIENTLWVALRMMEERKQLMEKMAKEENSKGWVHSANAKEERAVEMTTHIDRLKQLLFDAKKN